ncbi:MAG TPA: class I SAM-dependent methyltransferase, partial [Anaerolineales bacterium]
QGYDVVLLDATQANLDFAMRQVKRRKLQKRVERVVQGSIVDLSQFSDASFDAVLCTGGPLSHVLDPLQRATAISELIRVVKPGALLFVSVISRFGTIQEILTVFPPELTMPHYDLLLDTGDYFGGHGFTAAHFFLPEELKQAFTRPDVRILDMVGLEGVASQHHKELNRMAKDTKLFEAWMHTHFQTCTHPSVVGMSEHMLIICRKIVS